MSRKKDEEKLEKLKRDLRMYQEQKNRLIYLQRGYYCEDLPHSEDKIFEKMYMETARIELMKGRRPKDYDPLIIWCQLEINSLEERLSKSDAYNFVSDALKSATSFQHVRGRTYTYNDENDGCLKACVLYFILSLIVTLIVGIILEY